MALSLSCLSDRILQVLVLLLKSSDLEQFAIPAVSDVLYKPITLSQFCSQRLTILRKISYLLFKDV